MTPYVILHAVAEGEAEAKQIRVRRTDVVLYRRAYNGGCLCVIRHSHPVVVQESPETLDAMLNVPETT